MRNTLLAASLINTLYGNTSYYTSLDNISLESLSNIQIYTADRRLTTAKETSSVVSIITAKQIKDQGLKNLKQVLQRVPGMSTDFGTNVQPFVYHRGIKQDQNTGFLLLIDGVSQNSKMAYGFDMEHTFPHLFNVKQIEIIRGSNSTLWGSDAATAVINIITYTGSDLDKEKNGVIKTAYTYQANSKAHIADALWAKNFDDGSVMASVTYNESDAELDAFKQSWGTYKTGYSSWNKANPSYNLYLNASYQDFILTTRYSKQSRVDVNSIGYHDLADPKPDAKGDRDRKILSVNLKHNTKINKNFRVETQIGYTSNVLSEYRKNLQKEADAYIESSRYLESIVHFTSDDFQALMGAKYTQSELELGAQDSSNNKGGVFDENIKAVFTQISYTGLDDLKFIAGLRASKSDLRSTDTEIMPKFSTLYNMSDSWSSRYSYSTGFIHPLRVYNEGDDWWLSKTRPDGSRQYHNGTKLPQEVQTHEFQLAYNSDDLKVASTIFQVDIKNQFNWSPHYLDDKIGSDGIVEHYRILYGNVKHIQSQGLELEFDYLYSSLLSIYGNLTYQNSEYKSNILTSSHGEENDKYTVGKQMQFTPDTMYNLGVNLTLFTKSSLNIHYRGFDNFYHSSETHSLQSFLDINYRHKDMFIKNLNISIFGKNIFDNTQLGDDGLYGMTEMGSDFGFTLEYQF